jgi:large subunit ribosomal protein L35
VPKQKSNRSAAKRFRLSGGDKIVRRKAFHTHLLSGKTRKRKRSLKRPTIVVGVDLKKVHRMLGL